MDDLSEFVTSWRLRARSTVPHCTAEDAAEVVRVVEYLLAQHSREYRAPDPMADIARAYLGPVRPPNR